MGVFVACTHAISNLVTMNMDPKLGLEIAVSNAIGWVLAGLVIGLIYKPLAGSCAKVICKLFGCVFVGEYHQYLHSFCLT